MKGALGYHTVEVSSGTTSIGVRNNLVSWYKGAIHSIRVTHEALAPEDFTLADTSSNTENPITSNKVEADFSVKVLPNPSVGVIKIQVQHQEPGQVEINLYNLLGERIDHQINEVSDTGISLIHMDPGQLKKAYYLLEVKMGSYSRTLKIARL